MPIAKYLDILDDLLTRARKAGADAADALVVEGASLTIAERLGRPEKLERAEGQDLGLRVFLGKRQAIVSSTDFSSKALDELAARAVAMAKVVPEDPFCGIADPAEIATSVPDLDLCDPDEPSTETLIERVRAAEAAARAVPGVTNSEGAEASWGRSKVALAASNGFRQGYAGSHSGLSVSVVAGEGTGMQRDYDFTSAVYGSELEDPAAMGRRAGEKAVQAPQSAQGGDGQGAGGLRPAGRQRPGRPSARAPSTAPPSRAGSASSRTSSASASFPPASTSWTIPCARAACAPPPSTARGCPPAGASWWPMAC